MQERPLCVVGMSGVGKSFWAKRLEAAGWTRHDCDGEIARHVGDLAPPAPGEEPVHALGRWMGMPWSAGYAEREARYLALEAEVTARALHAAGEQHVIDATGSVIYLPRALRDELRRACRIAYLMVSPERRRAMLERYLVEPKPVVWDRAFKARPGEAPEEALPRCFAELLELRHQRYTELAHVVVDAGELEAHDPGLAGFLARVLA